MRRNWEPMQRIDGVEAGLTGPVNAVHGRPIAIACLFCRTAAVRLDRAPARVIAL